MFESLKPRLWEASFIPSKHFEIGIISYLETFYLSTGPLVLKKTNGNGSKATHNGIWRNFSRTRFNAPVKDVTTRPVTASATRIAILPAAI